MSSTTAQYQLDVADARPITSPYASPQITFQCRDGPTIFIPFMVVEKSAVLAARCMGNLSETQFLNVTHNAGHVLAHYLFTGAYEGLKPMAVFRNGREALELRTSIEVYAIARELALPGLEELAKNDIVRFSNSLPAVQVVDILGNAYPSYIPIDQWFRNHLEGMIKPLIDNPTMAQDTSINPANLSFSGCLLAIITDMRRAQASLAGRELESTGTSQAAQEEPATSQEEPATSQDQSEATINSELASLTVSNAPQTPGGRSTTPGNTESQSRREATPSAESASAPTVGLGNGHNGQQAGGRSANESVSPNASGPPQPSGSNSNVSSFWGRTSRTPSIADPGDVPSTVGVQPWVDIAVPGASGTTIDRMHSICANPMFERYSPEELRLAHEREPARFVYA